MTETDERDLRDWFDTELREGPVVLSEAGRARRVAMQTRLYLHPFWMHRTSTRLRVLPFGIVVERSPFGASLLIAYLRVPSNSRCFPKSVPSN